MNTLYAKGKQALLGDLDWSAATIKSALVTSAYTPNAATDEFLADIPGGAVLATSAALTGKTLVDGVADADNATFAAVAGGGSDGEFVVVYEDTGAGATSRLIVLVDTATGLPVTPNGGDIVVAWDSGANKIFKL